MKLRAVEDHYTHTGQFFKVPVEFRAPCDCPIGDAWAAENRRRRVEGDEHVVEKKQSKRKPYRRRSRRKWRKRPGFEGAR